MAENFANVYRTALSGAIDDSQTEIEVASASGAPAPNFRLKVENEYMLVTAVDSTTFTVEREIEGSTATAHPSGAQVKHIITAGGLAQFVSENAGGGPIVVGKNEQGASSEAMGSDKIYAKKVTVDSAGIFLSVGFRVRAPSAGQVISVPRPGVWLDNGGVVGDLLGVGAYGTITYLQRDGGGTLFDTWLETPSGVYVPAAGDYWIGGSRGSANSGPLLYYDTGGSDRTWTSAGYLSTGGTVFAQSNSTFAYSIRGHFLPA